MLRAISRASKSKNAHVRGNTRGRNFHPEGQRARGDGATGWERNETMKVRSGEGRRHAAGLGNKGRARLTNLLIYG